MRDSSGRYVKGTSGNPSGLRKQAEAGAGQEPSLADQAAARARLDGATIEMSQEHLDSWVSHQLGIGSRLHDKRERAHFQIDHLSYHEAIDIWRGDPMAKRAIEMLPADCFRQGYEILITDEGEYGDLKEDVEKRMRELKVDQLIERAHKYERAFGGAAILLNVKDGRTIDEPLDITKIDELESLTLMEPLELYPASYYQDPASPKYGEPEFYRLQSFTVSGAGTIIGVTDRRAPPPTTRLIHESRLIVFGGVRVSRYQRNTSLMGPLWGDSILVPLLEVLRDFNIAWGAAGIIATDFAQTVISIENLMQLVAKQPKQLETRLKAMDMARSVARAVLIDKNEKIERISTNTQGLPEILDRLSARLAAGIDVPLSLLLSNTPKGLGADALADVRWYFGRVKMEQTTRIGPILHFIVMLIMNTLRKKKMPKKVEIRFNELWQLTDAERAEARLNQARADAMYVKMGVLSSDELRRARFRGGYSWETPIEEKKKAPGFMAQVPAGVVPGTTPGAGGKPMMGPGGKVVKNAANAHSVSGYARRNPTQGALGANPKGGGDVVGGKQRRDAERLDDRPVHSRRMFNGIPVAVEAPAGSKLQFTRPDGSEGEVELRHDYGYVEGTNGADGDSVDCFLGPNEAAPDVHVVHVNDARDFSRWHQDKVMLGFDSPEHAKAALLAHYDDPRFYGGQTLLPIDKFISIYGLMSREQSLSGAFTGSEETKPLHTLAEDDESAVMPETTAGDRAEVAHLDDLGDEISQELKSDYPEDALKWIHDVDWEGPKRVDLKKVDYSNRAKWHASQDGEKDKVKKFAERITGGWEKPVLLVRRPGEPKLMIVDGHHRALAYRRTDKPMLAFVGDVSEKKGPWDEFHDSQRAKQDKHDRRADRLRVDAAVDAVTAHLDDIRRPRAEVVENFPNAQISALHLDRIIQRGSKWVVTNEAGTKDLGSYATKSQAVQRLRQVEYFKAHPDQAMGHNPEANVDAEDPLARGAIAGVEPGDEKIVGGWSEQEIGFEYDKPDTLRAKDKDVLSNPELKPGNGGDDR